MIPQQFVTLAFLPVIFITCTVTLSEIMDVVFNVESVSDFSKSCFMMFTMISACFKLFNLLIQHKSIIELLQKFNQGICLPMNPQELSLQENTERNIKAVAICYLLLVEGSVITRLLISILENVPNRNLAYSAWLPYNYTSSTPIFLTTYAYQYMGILVASLVHIVADVMGWGFMIKICGQIDILKFRLITLRQSTDYYLSKCERTHQSCEIKGMRLCICHHNQIFTLIRSFNDLWTMILVIQFGVSTFVICLTEYQLIKMDGINAELFSTIYYLLCMSSQIFMYCWYGNEVFLKCNDISLSMFAMDWDQLQYGVKKALILMTIRASKPEQITIRNVVTITLNTFMNLVKTSYSVFNVLQQW